MFESTDKNKIIIIHPWPAEVIVFQALHWHDDIGKYLNLREKIGSLLFRSTVWALCYTLC